MFDNLPAFCTLQYGTANELSHYLSAMPEDVRNKNVLQWWYDVTILTPFSISYMTDASVDALPTLFLAYCALDHADSTRVD